MATFLRIPNLYFETLLDVSQKTTCPKPLRLEHLSISQKCKTSATHYGNASRKRKTSATHYGNAFLVCMFQIGVSKRVLPKRSKPFILNAFGRFLKLQWSSQCCGQKNGPAQVDAKERPSGGCKVLIFPIYFEDLCLLRPRIFFKKCKNALVL